MPPAPPSTAPRARGELSASGAAPSPPLPSVLSSWARIIVDALRAKGIPPDAVLGLAGVSPDDLTDPSARLSLTATDRLWRAATQAADDPAFGLTASRHVRPTTFHALGYAVFASSSLRDALARLSRYGHLVSDAMDLVLHDEPGHATLRFVTPPGACAPGPEGMDAVLSLIVRTCRALTDGSFVLLGVALRRPCPADVTPYERVFRCPITFGAPLDALTVDAGTLDRPLPASNPELAHHNDELVRRYLSELRSGTLADRVRAVLSERLSGDASPSALAAVLGMSVRTLQRKLGEEGFTVVELRDATRREIGCALLLEGRRSITEVAFLLGFDDPSAFGRAFRRWTGLSPSEYRSRATLQQP